MKTEFAEPETTPQVQRAMVAQPREPHWDLAFFGIMAYLVVEYMRLSAQYPILLPLQIGKAVVGFTFLGYLVSHRRSGGDRSPVYSIDFTVGILVGVSFISACFAPDQNAAWTTVTDLIRWVMIYFLIGRVVNNPWRVRLFVFLLLLLNFKMAQAAIRGYGQTMETGMSAADMAKFGVGAGSVGFFSNAGDFGVAMCVVWPLAAMTFMGETKKIARIIFLVCALCFTAAIFVSSSRGAVVALVVTAAFGWIKNPKRIFAGLLVGLVLLSSVYLVSPAFKSRMESALHPESDLTANIRLELWKSGLRMFTSHPILGVGPGNFPHFYYSEHNEVESSKIVTAPHNIFIQAASELGLMGLLPVLALMFFLFRINAQTRKLLRASGDDAKQRFEYRMSSALDLALIAFVVSGSFLTVLYYPHLWVLLGLSVATYNCCARLEVRDKAPIREKVLMESYHAAGGF